MADTYSGDEPVELDCGDPSSTVFIPERLFARAQSVASAYELHLLPTINIYSTTRLNRLQCATLLDEVMLLGRVLNDDLLHEHLGRIHVLLSTCVGRPQGELVITGP